MDKVKQVSFWLCINHYLQDDKISNQNKMKQSIYSQIIEFHNYNVFALLIY